MNLPQKTGEPSSSRSSLHTEIGFYDKADALRAEFDEKISSSSEKSPGLTPFMYVYSKNQWQFLSAGADQIFSRAILDDVISRLSSWAADRLGTFHVSTPQVRLFVGGCKRELVQDNIKAEWHYLLSLTPAWPRTGQLKLLRTRGLDSARLGISEILKCRLAFNQLVVHPVGEAYGVDSLADDMMDPVSGITLLDGYLW
jgi:hypothetical protein